MRIHRILPIFFGLAALGSAQNNANWSKPFPPHKVIGNIYYVGSESLASFLIVTPQGNILINSCFEATVPVIRGSVEKLGFKFTDIKITPTLAFPESTAVSIYCWSAGGVNS